MNINYKILFITLILSLIISLLITFLSYSLSEKIPGKEKVSTYECGFDPFHSPGKPFSIRFFLIAILFLIFDLEITFLFPWSCVSTHISLLGQLVIIIFFLILIIGLIYEWINGGLEWE